jgi:uncharacterized protein
VSRAPVSTGLVSTAGPAIYACRVRHVRGEPLRHSFSYRTWLWLVDLDRLPELPRLLRPLASFRPADHLGRAGLTIRENVERFARERGVELAGGQILMLAHARSLGYVFNSLSVYWCYRSDGTLGCVLAEIHNTYSERHCYLLRPDDQRLARVAKDMYVSPFYGLGGSYSMRLPKPGAELALTVSLHPPGGRPLVATLRGRRRPGTAAGLLRAWASQPCPALVAAIRIRLQAVRLRLSGLPVVPRPRHPPQDGVW